MATTLLLVTACSKDDDSVPCPPDDNAPPAMLNYYPVKEGSYWVYDTYLVQPNGNQTLHRMKDTIFASGDTTMNGRTYYKFFGRLPSISLPRMHYRTDSAGYILTETGRVVMSYIDFENMIHFWEFPPDNVAFQTVRMEKPIVPAILPAGIFTDVLNAKVTTTHAQNGLLGTMDNLFAPGVGPILLSSAFAGQYLASQNYYEQRLVSYYIAP